LPECDNPLQEHRPADRNNANFGTLCELLHTRHVFARPKWQALRQRDDAPGTPLVAEKASEAIDYPVDTPRPCDRLRPFYGPRGRAYNACLSRHSQDVVVCEGPRQAYEVGPTTVQASSVTAAGYGYDERAIMPGSRRSPVPLHPGPMPVGSCPSVEAH